MVPNAHENDSPGELLSPMASQPRPWWCYALTGSARVHRTRCRCRNRRRAKLVHQENVLGVRLCDGGHGSVAWVCRRADTQPRAHRREAINSTISPEPLVAQSFAHIEPSGSSFQRCKARQRVRPRCGAHRAHNVVHGDHEPLFRVHKAPREHRQRGGRQFDHEPKVLQEQRK